MTNFLLLGVCFLSGILFRKFNKLPASTPDVLNSFIINISLPALTILHIHGVKINFELLIPISMAWVLFGLAAAFFNLIGKQLNWSRSIICLMILVCGLGNTSFLGLPMIEAYFGKEGIPTALIIDQLGTFLVLSTLGIFLVSFNSGSSFNSKSILKRIFTFPPFISILIALMLLPVEYPKELVSVLEKLGGTLSPLALFSVGYQISLSQFNSYKLELAVGLLFKLILAPAAIYFLYQFLMGEKGLTFDVTVFESAMPPMITAAIVASQFKLNKELASMLVGIGIVISFLTLFLWWMILVCYNVNRIG